MGDKLKVLCGEGVGENIINLEEENEFAARQFSGGQPSSYSQLKWWENHQTWRVTDYMPGFDYIKWLTARMRR
jgi:hypothetical protein